MNETRRAFIAYQEAQTLLEVRRLAVGEADEALRMANLSYANGIMTTVELSGIELAHTQAKVGYARALHDSTVSRSRLMYAIGLPLPTQPW